jgi:hypothetical protein
MSLKAVVVHEQASAVEKMWADQFAGQDAAVKAQFPTVVNWAERSPTVFKIPSLTWPAIVSTVTNAAKAAGPGGVVILASGHGGSVDASAGIINWDATEPPGGTHARDWTPQKVGKGLFWDEPVSKYTDPIPFGNPPTLKQEDEGKIARQVPGWQALQMRHDAFDALQAIGKALQDNQVNRLTFTVCSAGASTDFMDRIAKHCHAQVACFRVLTLVLDDGTLGFRPGKGRLILNSDASATDPVKNPATTNTPLARVFSPNLDNSGIAYVAHP